MATIRNIPLQLIFLFLVSLPMECGTSSVRLFNDANIPLHIDTIIALNDRENLDAIFSRGEDLNRANSLGFRPLHIAMMNHNREMAGLLLEKGAHVNFTGPYSPAPFPPNVIKWKEISRTFFLTFDLGVDNTHLDYILGILKKYRITATFFITGIFIKKYPAQVMRIVQEGHVAGNHTLTHTMYYSTKSQLVTELTSNEKLFHAVTGRKMSGIWRSPGLQHIYRPWQVEAAYAAGYRHIDVSLLSLDYTPPGDERYINNDRFMTVFTGHVDSGLDERYYISSPTYYYFLRNVKKPDYRGLILLMHSEKYRRDRLDFIYCLESIITHLISRGYYFDNFRRFGIDRMKIKEL